VKYVVTRESDGKRLPLTQESEILRKFQKELNSGTVSLVTLAFLNVADEPMYGYQIAKQLEAAAGGVPLMKQGTLYPLLRSLERNGLLTSEVEPSVSGPPRRYYQITPMGRQTLDSWKKAWGRTRDFVETVVGGEQNG
jgi:PadR family transcriptional regulator PadR